MVVLTGRLRLRWNSEWKQQESDGRSSTFVKTGDTSSLLGCVVWKGCDSDSLVEDGV